MADGIWIIAGQVLALEPWRLNLSAGVDSISSATLGVKFPNLLMELWERSMLLQIAAAAGNPQFIDNYTEETVKGGYAKACVQIDIVAKGRRRWQGPVHFVAELVMRRNASMSVLMRLRV